MVACFISDWSLFFIVVMMTPLTLLFFDELALFWTSDPRFVICLLDGNYSNNHMVALTNGILLPIPWHIQ
jgi:hypothetical protein